MVGILVYTVAAAGMIFPISYLTGSPTIAGVLHTCGMLTASLIGAKMGLVDGPSGKMMLLASVGCYWAIRVAASVLMFNSPTSLGKDAHDFTKRSNNPAGLSLMLGGALADLGLCLVQFGFYMAKDMTSAFLLFVLYYSMF